MQFQVEVPGETAGFERILTWQAPSLKFGVGATKELGHELLTRGMRSVLLVTDPNLAALGLPAAVAKQLAQQDIAVQVFDRSHVEPTDVSCADAARETADADVDGYVALGGGSSIDTAKMLNLLGSYPGVGVRDYLNKPVGAGRPIPGPLKPLVALPTTAGTGSECTAMVALGVVKEGIKTGISDARLIPSLALVDPAHSITAPPAVTASSGYDVLTHACESYTARSFDRRPPYPTPAERPIYIGANPVSDVWAREALRLVGTYFRRAVLNPHDLEARTGMSQAATFAGLGFGNAGTHIPHACAYPIAGRVREYRPEGYEVDHPMVPHGAAVISTAAAAFEFTYPTAPERHLEAAALLGANLDGVTPAGGADVLPATLHALLRDTGGPTGPAAFGYGSKDIPALAEGAMKQQRLLVCCPREVREDDLRAIFARALGG